MLFIFIGGKNKPGSEFLFVSSQVQTCTKQEHTLFIAAKETGQDWSVLRYWGCLILAPAETLENAGNGLDILPFQSRYAN